jgi:anion-transporting  ArsA/GET3 family ATPase
VTISERLAGKRICICAGAGGVGKTTTSAALAMGLAAQGRRVAVVTIDPAKRLANALGLDALGNEPHLVDPAAFRGHGIEMRGELWAMMLDAKRTFDDLIERLAPDSATRDDVLGNRIYQQLSSSLAGSQEFTAIAKLYELDREGGFDVLVLDTPPSRNALDFLDSPDRLTAFLEGRALKAFMGGTGFAARVVGRGTGVVLSILRRITGVDLLQDTSAFFQSLGGLTDGFRERARGVKALLCSPDTTFLIVTSPAREPVEEAIFFRGKLRDARLPFGGLVVNRVQVPADEDHDAEAAALAAGLDAELAVKVGQTVAELQVLAERDQAAIERLRRELDEPDPILVPHLDGDVHDVDGLVAVLRHLFSGEIDGALPTPATSIHERTT